MTFDIGLHEVCVRVGVLYVITKFSRMDTVVYQILLPMVLRCARARARELRYNYSDPGGTIRGGWVLPYMSYMGYMGMCRCEGYGFQAVVL